jgi:hypothetical protein
MTPEELTEPAMPVLLPKLATSRPAGPLDLHPKVTASLLAGWATTIVLYALATWAHVQPPGVVDAAIVGLLTFAAGWLAPTLPEEDVA